MNHKAKTFSFVIAIVILFSSMGTPALAASAPILSTGETMVAAHTCQCVEYIKNKYNLSGSAGYAKNMGVFLKNRGFWKLTVPRPGEIIIMKPIFGHGVDSVAGHVAIIHSVIDQGSTWKITVRGANQGNRSSWTESNCTNVSFWTSIVYPKTQGSNYVEYWVKGTN